jgi:hypothetical protein
MAKPGACGTARKVTLAPYLPGKGPRFTLILASTGKRDPKWGKPIFAYELRMGRETLFAGSDYETWALLESKQIIDDAIALLCNDSEDRELNEAQAAFMASPHAQVLRDEASIRFGE